MSIEWRTYIEPVRHVRAEVTEANVLDFCREFGWSIKYVEKAVAPHPTGRAMVMQVTGHGINGRPAEVPFWVDQRGDSAYKSNAPWKSWAIEGDQEPGGGERG